MAFDISFFEEKISDYRSRGLKIFASSSFQTHSIPMLHIISRVDNTIPVYFLNTGYHFPETVSYKDRIAEIMGLRVIDLFSPVPRNMQTDIDGRLLFASDPDYCCHLNKILPMEPVLSEFDVWIAGVRKDQNSNRQQMNYEEKGPKNTIRFHPMLDFNRKMIYQYINEFNLPKHPLEEKGYISVGCEPCTQKLSIDSFIDDRSGRWKGMKKTECGLHTELRQKN